MKNQWLNRKSHWKSEEKIFQFGRNFWDIFETISNDIFVFCFLLWFLGGPFPLTQLSEAIIIVFLIFFSKNSLFHLCFSMKIRRVHCSVPENVCLLVHYINYGIFRTFPNQCRPLNFIKIRIYCIVPTNSNQTHFLLSKFFPSSPVPLWHDFNITLC